MCDDEYQKNITNEHNNVAIIMGLAVKFDTFLVGIACGAIFDKVL